MIEKRWNFYYIAAGIATAAIVFLSSFVAWTQRQERYSQAEASVVNHAAALAIQVEDSFDQVNALLISVAIRYADSRLKTASEIKHFTRQVMREVPAYTVVSRLGIADERGTVVFNTGFDAKSPRSVSIADRGYFQRARDGEKGMQFEGPVQARLDKEWSLVLARRIESERGEFIGVAFVVVPVQRLGKVFSQISLGSSGSVNLRTLDLAQVFRYPDLSGTNQGIGNRNVSQTIQDLMRTKPGQDRYVYTTVAPIDGIERIYTYRKFAHSPFWMTVGLATADFETSWRRTALLLAVLSLALGSFLFWVARRMSHQKEDLEQRVKERTQALTSAIRELDDLYNHAPCGYHSLANDGTILRMNDTELG
jgi:hypothetical protein